jgi:hypothetical protein
MWSLLDQYDFNNENFDEIEDKYTCDNDCCESPCLQTPYHHYKIGNGACIDLCDDCYSLNCTLKNLFMIYDDDGIKICMMCDNKFNGKFKICQYKGIIINVCEICCDDYDIYVLLKSKFVYVTGHVVCSNNSLSPSMLNVDNIKKRNIDIRIKNMITWERNEIWVSCFDAIIDISPNFNLFGPIRGWTLFTDLYDIPDSNISCGLLIDCVGSRVATLIKTNNKKVKIIIIYDSFEKYITEYDAWTMTKLSDDELQNTILKYSGKVINKNVRALLCEEFSGYITVKMSLF